MGSEHCPCAMDLLARQKAGRHASIVLRSEFELLDGHDGLLGGKSPRAHSSLVSSSKFGLSAESGMFFMAGTRTSGASPPRGPPVLGSRRAATKNPMSTAATPTDHHTAFFDLNVCMT